MKYNVIIPAKNEENNIEAAVFSILNQTAPPNLILVADNESTDKTAEKIKALQQKHSNLIYLNYKGEKKYSLGGKIVKIFKYGKKHIDNIDDEYDYIVKMDADVILEKDVFLKIFNKIKNSNYGIVSPLAYIRQNQRVIYNSTPDWHTSGDLKIYNKKCYEEIGGLKEDLGWDCADNIFAIEKGYKTAVLKDVSYEQKRPMGRYSLLQGWKRQGTGAYKLRYNYFYFFIKFFHDFFRKPLIIGSFICMYSFIKSHFDGTTRVLDKKQGKILRKLFWKSLFSGTRKKRFYLFQLLVAGKN